METWGYIASAFIGISLGLIGGGGSVLTMPVMVYLFGVPPMLATSYSLFIVGSTSLVGAINNYSKGLVHTRAALFFGATSILTVFLTRKFVLPAIPHHIATINGFAITSSLLTMVLFAALMVLSATRMIRNKSGQKAGKECNSCITFSRLAGYGLATGLITGLLGAGGGFLLIPALILTTNMPMKKAVGTSLLIIAFNSLIGFAGDFGHTDIDWRLLVTTSLVAIGGIFMGGWLSKKIAGEKLKKGFGWFVLVMGVYILLKEILK